MKTTAKTFCMAFLALGSGVVPLEVAALTEPPMLTVDGTGDAQSNEGHTVSADGRYVVFSSFATNLVANDNNGAQDVFLWDRVVDTITLVSSSSTGALGNGDSSLAVISADGAWVAFLSVASNLTADSNGGVADVFLYSRLDATLELVSVSSAGMQSGVAANNPDINANGRYVTFDTTGDLADGAGSVVQNVFRRDNWRDNTMLISRTPAGVAPDNMSLNAQMSADGDRVVFVSMATNLVTTPTVGKDSFLFDVGSGVTTLLSLNSSGVAGDGTSYFPTISGDGKVAAFHTFAGNLVLNDAEGVADVVLRDLETGTLELISATNAAEGGDSDSIHPALDFTGDRVAYTTFAGNLVTNDIEGHADAVVFDRVSQTTTRLSQTGGGVGGNGDSGSLAISFTGTTAVLLSRANNLSTSGTAFGDLLVATLPPVAPSTLPVVAAAVLPSSRSAQIGSVLTVFAVVVGTEVVNGCSIALDSSLDIDLSYQLTDPSTNAPIGPVDTDFLLFPGSTQTLLLALRPNVALTQEELEFQVICDLGSAPVVPGTNTLLVSAEASQPPDVVVLAATLDSDGIMKLPLGGVGGFFAVASINVGSEGDFTVRPVVLGQALDAVSICQTAPVTGVCLAAPSQTVRVAINNGETPTFGVFASNATQVPFSPAVNRLVLQFEDANGTVRGRTSVAVQSVL